MTKCDFVLQELSLLISAVTLITKCKGYFVVFVMLQLHRAWNILEILNNSEFPLVWKNLHFSFAR